MRPLQEFDACTMANKLLSTVGSQHGLPEYIMNDHYPRFGGFFWDQLMSLLDTTLTFSMALHPQADGMAGITNHTME